jgi:arginyl-tRNA synthetase
MGFEKELVHASYDFVTLKEGAMSSRKGNVIRYETLRDTARDLAAGETKKRHADWSEKQIAKTATAVADAALWFVMLRQDPDKAIAFDMKEAMSFEGFTGPYLLYSFARIKSLLKKAGRAGRAGRAGAWTHATEHRLLLLLGQYPDIVFQAGTTYRLSALSQYLFELCQAFASFYEAVPVLQSEDKNLVASRLALVDAIGQVLENGCGILGLRLLNEM